MSFHEMSPCHSLFQIVFRCTDSVQKIMLHYTRLKPSRFRVLFYKEEKQIKLNKCARLSFILFHFPPSDTELQIARFPEGIIATKSAFDSQTVTWSATFVCVLYGSWEMFVLVCEIWNLQRRAVSFKRIRSHSLQINSLNVFENRSHVQRGFMFKYFLFSSLNFLLVLVKRLVFFPPLPL